MNLFRLDDLLARQRAGRAPWLEFLGVPDLTLGLYVLEAGAVDDQQPHTEDELYVILAGRSRFTCGDETRDVGPGDTIHVPAGVSHRYHDITEALRIIYAFAPREGTRALNRTPVLASRPVTATLPRPSPLAPVDRDPRAR